MKKDIDYFIEQVKKDNDYLKVKFTEEEISILANDHFETYKKGNNLKYETFEKDVRKRNEKLTNKWTEDEIKAIAERKYKYTKEKTYQIRNYEFFRNRILHRKDIPKSQKNFETEKSYKEELDFIIRNNAIDEYLKEESKCPLYFSLEEYISYCTYDPYGYSQLNNQEKIIYLKNRIVKIKKKLARYEIFKKTKYYDCEQCDNNYKEQCKENEDCMKSLLLRFEPDLEAFEFARDQSKDFKDMTLEIDKSKDSVLRKWIRYRDVGKSKYSMFKYTTTYHRDSTKNKLEVYYDKFTKEKSIEKCAYRTLGTYVQETYNSTLLKIQYSDINKQKMQI
ncbi:MAG: hypothetical protein JXR69_06940 [Candidatus Delongbacteria bacterium]|nr:hypothetical protein [Candidatus Delongbacteria bacterium]